MITISTLVSEDGVIGLNGKRYLLDDEDELILFKSIDEAREFVEDNGEDPDNEYIDYEEHKSEKELWENNNAI
tara:strand:- start:576 stop:794 length:219 start_codon:yes stop_codon:yes gene_type:complete